MKVFRIPLSQPARLNQWLIKIRWLPPPGKKCGGKGGIHEPGKQDTVCSSYFVKGMYISIIAL